MTEETTKPKKEFKNRYVRINKVVELYNAGTTDFEALIVKLAEFESGIALRRGIKVLRDHKFYSKSVFWCLKTAAKQGLITWTEFKKPRAKKVPKQAISVEPPVSPAVVNTESEVGIPTL